MSVHTPHKPKTKARPAQPIHPWGVRPALWHNGLLAAVPLFLAVFILTARMGLPVGQSFLWAAAFAALLPLRLTWGERLARWLPRLAFVLAPLVGFCLVEVMNYNHPTTSFTGVQVALNLAWYYMLAALVYLAAGRLTMSAGVSAALFFLVGLANRYIIRFRGRTIFPGDLLTLRTAANVASKYDYSLDGTQFVCLLALGLFLLILWKFPQRKGRQMPRLRVILPVAALAAVYLAVFFQTDFLRKLEIEPSLWTTRGNGFVLNFTVCLRYSTVEAPDGYSAEALARVEQEMPGAARPEGEKPVNVIVVMNESLSDLTETLGLESNQDPMPFLRGLTENTVKGTAYSSVFGGTTANSEYEFMTGNTMAFLPEGTVPYQMYVTPGAPNLGRQMKDLGYETVFMHCYMASGWNRRAVYKDFGFDRIYFQSDLKDLSFMREYVTDRSNYENLIRIYEEKEPGAPLFFFNVTMQNHSAYNVPWTGLDRTTWLTGPLEGRFKTVDQYLSLARESDSAFEYLVDYFSQVEEPTMILMFGDHQPQVATNFYTQVLGGEFADLDAATQQKKQAVPFVLWANYDIPEQEGVELSLNYLSTLLTETADLPQTEYQRFLAQLRQTVPAINGVGFRDADGNWYKDRKDMPEEAQKRLLEYEMLQYNQLFEDESDRLTGFFELTEEEAAP